MGRGRNRAILWLLAALLLPLAARAESADDLGRAKTHFVAGRALYELGNYPEAIREFSAGHRLAPRPQFLLNLGQCYRKLGDLEQARAMYRRFLGEVGPDDPQRAEAQEVLAVIERSLAEHPQPPGSVRAAAPGDAAAGALVKPALASRRPFIKRHWWIIPASVVVAGVGVGLGVYYGTRSSSPCSSANLGCWNLEH
jgi:tetratricopeptide (TPR) repeat protein